MGINRLERQRLCARQSPTKLLTQSILQVITRDAFVIHGAKALRIARMKKEETTTTMTTTITTTMTTTMTITTTITMTITTMTVVTTNQIQSLSLIQQLNSLKSRTTPTTVSLRNPGHFTKLTRLLTILRRTWRKSTPSSRMLNSSSELTT